MKFSLAAGRGLGATLGGILAGGERRSVVTDTGMTLPPCRERGPLRSCDARVLSALRRWTSSAGGELRAGRELVVGGDLRTSDELVKNGELFTSGELGMGGGGGTACCSVESRLMLAVRWICERMSGLRRLDVTPTTGAGLPSGPARAGNTDPSFEYKLLLRRTGERAGFRGAGGLPTTWFLTDTLIKLPPKRLDEPASRLIVGDGAMSARRGLRGSVCDW